MELWGYGAMELWSYWNNPFILIVGSLTWLLENCTMRREVGRKCEIRSEVSVLST